MNENDAMKKGFNAGYWLEKYDPKLSRIIQDAFGNGDAPYAQGFVKGSKEYIQESFYHTMKASQKDIEGLEQNDLTKDRGINLDEKDTGIDR